MLLTTLIAENKAFHTLINKLLIMCKVNIFFGILLLKTLKNGEEIYCKTYKKVFWWFANFL